MTGPIAEEFAVFKKEVSLGLNTKKPWRTWLPGSRANLDLAITAVMIQRQVGRQLG